MTYKPLMYPTKRGIEVTEFYAGSYQNIVTIEELLKVDIRLDPLRVVVDFSIAAPNIIEYLVTQTDYKPRENNRQKEGVFEINDKYISVFVGELYVIYITDYHCKYLQDFIDFETAEKLDKVDEDRRPTAAQDSKHAYYSFLNPSVPHGINIFNLRYPKLTGKEQLYCVEAKNFTAGVIYARQGEHKDIYSYDMKQSYPARLLDSWSPYGEGKYFEGEAKLPARYWYVKKIRIYRIAPKVHDFLEIIPRYAAGKPFSVTVSKECEEILQRYYSVQYRTIDGFYYKCRRGSFDAFLLRFMNDERNDFRPIRTYNKAKCNLLIGTMGLRPKPRKIYTIHRRKLVIDTTDEMYCGRYYYPLYLFVTGRAKFAFCELAARVWDNVVYCHTDSLLLTKPFRTLQLRPHGTPGHLEYREFYKRLAVKKVNNYCGEYVTADGVLGVDIRLSGLIHKPSSYEEFTAGYESAFLQRQRNGFITIKRRHEPAMDALSDETLMIGEFIETDQN